MCLSRLIWESATELCNSGLPDAFQGLAYNVLVISLSIYHGTETEAELTNYPLIQGLPKIFPYTIYLSAFQT
ncbi:hypothetical protein HID58_033909, partial [Brassica napus]